MGKSPKNTGGPVVKTGPTAGKNRSRKKDGKWRKKRSDSGKSKKSNKSGGCFLTTVSCQYKGLPENCHELEVLREFRNNHLLTSDNGRKIVEHYYAIAPPITKRLNNKSDFEYIWDVVRKCVNAIECQQFQHAIDVYRTMVESLEERLLNKYSND
jgi:hypothetical protein